TTLPPAMLHVKNLRLPLMPHAELADAVQFEARNALPFSPDEAVLRHIPAGEVRQGAEMLQEVILVAARQAEVDQYVEHLHAAGLVVDSLDIEPCALFRTVDRYIRRRDDEQLVHVLVEITARRSQVVIGRGRDIHFVKTIDVGGRDLQDAVARKLGIGLKEAAALRVRLADEGGDAGDDPVRQAVYDATRAVAEQLGREIA